MNSVSLLIKPASSSCNLRCRYCFYEDEAQNRSRHSMGFLSESLANALIAQAFALVDTGGTVSFAFQGGEPTLVGLPFFRRFVAAVDRLRPAGVQVQYTIQTNGTLLDDDWADFLHSNHVLVGLSIDGIRAVHDTYRLDSDGQGTWKRVLAARTLLEKHSVDYNALCVLTGPCAEDPDRIYQNLKNLGFRYLQFIACLDPIGHPRGQEPWSLSPERYGRFLCRLFDLWYRDWESGNYHSIRLFDEYIHILLGDGTSTCATCGQCGSYLVVEADGSVYPCDFYVLDEWRLGTLHESTLKALAMGDKAAQFLIRDTPADCAACPHRRICGGGCKADWYTDASGFHNYHCSAIRALLDHALPRMQRIADAERAARGTPRSRQGR